MTRTIVEDPRACAQGEKFRLSHRRLGTFGAVISHVVCFETLSRLLSPRTFPSLSMNLQGGSSQPHLTSPLLMGRMV
jgi:hypothetical protein